MSVARVRGLDACSPTGAIARVAGHDVEVRGLRLAVGDALTVHTGTGDRPAEVVGLGPEGVRALLLADTAGLARGDRVSVGGAASGVVVGEGLLGRTLDALGRPVDGRGPLSGERVGLDLDVPPALARRRITEPLPVGVRLVDTLATVGRGQRMGIFAGSGVGKSTLLGMMVRGTTADVNVVALIGERGREVREFLEDDLGSEGMARTVVVVATSDEPPLVRLRAGFLATRIAEWFADRGADVLLTMDSLTRLAMAQRDVGLAAGEPPTARGYTPSVFTLLPRLLERAGPRTAGSITGFYTVLVEGDDMNDPVADAARSILDGHLVLDRRLATAGRYPPIDPLASLSRLAGKVVTPERRRAATAARAALAAAAEVRDLVEVGAYAPGTNPEADRGLALQPAIVDFLRQDSGEPAGFEDAWARLAALVGDDQEAP
ncbi:MAG TPA: FliI/YscN family ATPase [Egibacteraceae bacterium]|nr:FliI/YscN family ATPase [Egibacteraceae bacterium]